MRCYGICRASASYPGGGRPDAYHALARMADDAAGEGSADPGPTACDCCGGTRLRKLGETVTETLEVVPRRWKVIQHVREKMTCRDCEKVSEPPAPFHVTRHGGAMLRMDADGRAPISWRCCCSRSSASTSR